MTAAPARVPPALVDQLAPGGRMIVPVGVDTQDLRVITRTDAGVSEQSLLPVRFVPLISNN